LLITVVINELLILEEMGRSLLHSPSTRWTILTQMGVSGSTVSATPSTSPSLQFKTSSPAAWCLGTSLRVYRAALAWSSIASQLQQRQLQWQRSQRRRLTALETTEKNDRDGSTLKSDSCKRVHNLQAVISCNYFRFCG